MRDSSTVILIKLLQRKNLGNHISVVHLHNDLTTFFSSDFSSKTKDVSSLKSLIWTLTSTMSYLTASEPVMKTGPEALENHLLQTAQLQMTYVKSYLTFPNLDFYRNYFVLAKCQWNHRCCQ